MSGTHELTTNHRPAGPYPKVDGQCPLGCGQTLFLGEGGHVTCSHVDCPEPDAVATLLEERETEHVVTFGPVGFTIKHPLRERLHNDLEECELHEFVLGLAGPPVQPGRYRAYWDEDEWVFVPLKS